MAAYQDGSTLRHIVNQEFDKTYKPGATPPYSGIYRCQGCGVEIVAEQERTFPPTRACEEHHPESKLGHVLWRLSVFADHTGAI